MMAFFQPSDIKLKRLEGLATGVWTMKSGSASFSSERHKTDQRSALFATQLGWLMTRRARHWRLENIEKL